MKNLHTIRNKAFDLFKYQSMNKKGFHRSGIDRYGPIPMLIGCSSPYPTPTWIRPGSKLLYALMDWYSQTNPSTWLRTELPSSFSFQFAVLNVKLLGTNDACFQSIWHGLLCHRIMILSSEDVGAK